MVMVVLVGHIAVCSAAYEYALNYGAELSDLEKEMPVAVGLAWGYYAQSCASAESIVAARVAAFLQTDAGVAAGLVRLFFHDCFVQVRSQLLFRVPPQLPELTVLLVRT